MALSFAVSDFKSNLASGGGGARPALYKIDINHPDDTDSAFDDASNILVKAAAIPASNIAPLTINYMGRAYKQPGFRTFDVWNVTVINDENFQARNRIMHWMRSISGQLDGGRTTTHGAQHLTGSRITDGNATVTQLGTDGEDKQSWNIIGLWPTELGEIPLDWSSDAIEEYTVAFAYDWWEHGAAAEETDTHVDSDTEMGDGE